MDKLEVSPFQVSTTDYDQSFITAYQNTLSSETIPESVKSTLRKGLLVGMRGMERMSTKFRLEQQEQSQKIIKAVILAYQEGRYSQDSFSEFCSKLSSPSAKFARFVAENDALAVE